MSSNTGNGYAGKILRVDLTNERVTEETLDAVELRKWVGGVGFGAKYLYDEVPPEVQWDDPANRLIVATGPLAGTRMGGSGTISFSTKGCLTNGATSTQANGFMGAYMKFSGYDAIIFQGAARRWVYLYLHDGKAEIRDAQYLLGKNTWETEDAIKAELGYTEKGMSVFCIGPAGENLVKFAGIFGDKDHAAGHNGSGAVMGSKKLKAFCAARGKATLSVADSKRLSANAEAIWDLIQTNPLTRRIFDWGTGGTYESRDQQMAAGTLPIKNYTTNAYAEGHLMTTQYTREHYIHKPNPCWACRMHHLSMVTITEGPHRGQTVEDPEYEMYAAMGPLVGNTDPAETLVLSNLLTLLGLEGNEAGFLVSMVIDLYESGMLSKEDTNGLELTWGNTAAIRSLLERIASRQGAFANILAEGTKRAAEALGPEAEERGIYAMKGHSPRGHDHRAMWREMFDTATSDIGTYEAGYMGPADPDTHALKNIFSPEEVSAHTAKTKGRRQFEDTLGTCTFCTRVPLRMVTDTLNAATGWNFSPEEAQAVGFRAANLLRAFNIKHGIGVELEQPSARWSSAPVDGPAKGITIVSEWENMLDNYYRLMGWDRVTGKPFPETLKAYGLEYVVPDMWP
ncbi:MAG: aldehyde ferredoxin oxidoreductase C-terminal domain-containing protein [Dehalococcoidales bacterium]|nr:aldehyde ferredoxin oxidoreductase C-terminal domain-containing protein [Dehalococcoidales bacterium]